MYWDTVYEQRGPEGVSWYQPVASTSLELVDVLGVPRGGAVVDVGGGTSALATGLVERGFTDVSVVDISASALSSARERRGADSVTWLHDDVLDWRPRRRFDLWHDRAVFHFLTDPDDRARYLAVLGSAIRPGGAVVLATFAPDGPQSCSGLPVVRYSARQLAEALGEDFRTVHARREEHTTPTGAVQVFTWVAGRIGETGRDRPTVRLIEADQAPLLARPFYGDGDPGPIVASLAQVPELLEVAIPFIGTTLGPSSISWRAKELVIVRTSALLECQYCVRTHTAVALDAGLTREEIHALRGTVPVGSAFHEPRELALLRWVDAVAGERGGISDDTTNALREHWDDHEVVELTILVGATMMLNRFATALRLPVADATEQRLAEEDLL